jgi:hypothetical protein
MAGSAAGEAGVAADGQRRAVVAEASSQPDLPAAAETTERASRSTPILAAFSCFRNPANLGQGGLAPQFGMAERNYLTGNHAPARRFVIGQFGHGIAG